MQVSAFQQALIDDADLNAWIDAQPQPEELPLNCGQCNNYSAPKPGRWGFCTIRAAADLHPCNLPPWSDNAKNCCFFDIDCPF